MRDINDMTREEFEALPCCDATEDSLCCHSIVVLPTGTPHPTTGYQCMDFIPVRDHAVSCRLSGNTDLLLIDGVGGYGDCSYAALVPPKAWMMDCLRKSGLLQLRTGRVGYWLQYSQPSCNFEIVAVPKSGEAKGEGE